MTLSGRLKNKNGMLGQQTASAATGNDHFGATIREDKNEGAEFKGNSD
jgi:hypothetical protein